MRHDCQGAVLGVIRHAESVANVRRLTPHDQRHIQAVAGLSAGFAVSFPLR